MAEPGVEAQPPPAPGLLPPRAQDVVAIVVAAAVVAVAAGLLMPFNTGIAETDFHDAQGTPTQDVIAGKALFHFTSGQWAGLLPALVLGAVLMIGRGRSARVLPLALLAGVPLALAQALIGVPTGLGVIDELHASAREFVEVPPLPWAGMVCTIAFGGLGFPLATALGATVAARRVFHSWGFTAVWAAALGWLAACCPSLSMMQP